MAKRLNVDLTFNADTNEAKKKIQELQQSLRDVAKLPGAATELFDDASIKKASEAALELERHLSKAVNVDTGKLDLSRFSQSLKSSGKDLNSYCNTLLSIGPAGQQAFLKLAQAIATADAPVTRVNNKLKELGTTLANTARWQLSSSILHGFMGAVQSAYGYAQDLNSSLNDIRIVTGKNADEMAKFAKKANDAARALSVTTTEYTEASLIYFQQGDSMAEVEEKAAVTTKLAQVTGQSMEEVSNQLTAVWNNFYDGSQSLEHYADAMAHLGAITASSSDEIAQGLEKFAAVADMIGLGFDQAAAALATVTANTRQSADVVGTSFKTIFARIQGLNLGETLDDGTTLNKYSAALAKVGIDIKDTNGQMKDMNTILNEMGEKWGTLSKDQQTALAQTVAGVRQYGQLVSLMENFDEYQANLTEAQGSDGALQEQADIYAESWEAARDRVRTALEGVYQSLIKDDFFIDLLDGLAKLIDGIKTFIDTMGGLGGVVQMVGGFFIATFADKVPALISNVGQNIRTLTGMAKKDMQAVQQELNVKLTEAQVDSSLPESFRIQAEGLAKVNLMKEKLVNESNKLSQAEKEEYEARIRNVQSMYADIDVLAKKKEAAEGSVKSAKSKVKTSAGSKATEMFQSYNQLQDQASAHEEKYTKINTASTTGASNEEVQARLQALEREAAALDTVRQKATEVEGQITALAKAYGLSAEQVDKLVLDNGKLDPAVLDAMKVKAEEVSNAYGALEGRRATLENIGTSVRSQTTAWEQVKEKTAAASKELENIGKKKKGQELVIKETEAMRKKMVAYVKAVETAAKNKGLHKVAKQAQATAASLADVAKNATMDDLINTFGDMEGTVEESLGTVNEDLTKVSQSMVDMNFDPSAMEEMKIAAEEAAEADVQLNNALENTNNQAEESPKAAFKMSETLTAVGGAAMSTMAAITALKTGFATIFSEDTSWGEKLAAGISIATTAMGAYNAAVAVSTALSKADKIAKLGAAIGQGVANAAAAIGIGVKTGETAAVTANTAAWYANPIMWIALIVMGAIAAIIGLVAGIVALSNALKAMDPGEKLKAAEEEANRMDEAFQKAKSAADELRASIDKYDTAADKMKGLVKGTEEYQAALNEANDEARKLINENSELQGKYHINVETGLIEFDEGALEEVQAKADDTARKAQNQALLANNNVAAAKNVVAIKDAAGSDGNQTAGIVGNAILASLIPGIGPLVAGAIGAANAGRGEDDQEAAIQKLADEFSASGGNLAVAMASLSDDERHLIESMEKNGVDIMALAQEISANTDAISENNKQLLYNNFSDRESFEESSNKDFLLDSMQDDLKSATAEKEAEYDKKKDKDVQAEYAKMMGWGEDVKTETKDGVVTYTDSNGNELGKVGEDNIRSYLAQEAAMQSLGASFDEQAKKVEELSDRERFLAKEFEKGNITYEQYTEAVKQAGTEIGFTAEEMNKYTKEHGSDNIKRERKEQGLAGVMATKFDMGDANAKKFVDEITKDMTDEQLELALDIAATAESLDDFKRQFQHASTEALINSINASQENVSTMLASADENGKFAAEDLASLETDENFTAWLEQTGQTMRDLTNASYTEQYNMISQFYSDLQKMESANLELQKQNYQDDLAEYQAIMDYKIAAEEGNAAAMASIQESWGNAIDFEAYMDLDIGEIQTKLDTVAQAIEDITNQKYELDLSWDGVDQLEGSFDELAGVTKMMEKEARKVGNSYQLTAAQGKEWMEMYPELFDNAKVTTDGLIELSEEDYEAFKATQEAERKAAIETEIQKLKARLEELDAEEEAAKAELAMIEAIAQGEVDYENASAESIAATRQNLTQFYIDSGYDEVQANELALQQMGLTQEQYNDFIGESAKANAQDMVDGAYSGAEATKKTYGSLAEKLKAIFSNIGNAIKAVFTGDWDSIGGYFSAAWDAAKTKVEKGSVSSSKSEAVDANIGGKIEKYNLTAVLQESGDDALAKARENIQGNLDKISASRKTIGNQITYLEALSKQGMENFGETSVDTISPEAEKEIEHMEEALERYHEINDAIAEQEHKLDMLSKAKERAYGKNKIALMKQEVEEMKKLNALQQDKIAADKYNLANDLTEVDKIFEGTGVSTTLTDGGSIANYTAMQEAAQKAYNDFVDEYNKKGTHTEEEEKALEDAEKLYEDRIAALEQYHETLETVRDDEAAAMDQMNQIMEQNFEILNADLELDLEINASDMAMVDYYLSKVEDDMYGLAEGLTYMMGVASEGVFEGGQLEGYLNNLEAYEDYKAAADAAFASGDIGPDQYAEAMKNVTESTLAELQSLQSLDDEMMQYYSKTLSKASEELDKHTAKMDRQTAVLDHYHNLMSITGRETDYESMGAILEGQAHLIQNELNVAEAELKMYSEQTDYWKSQMDSAVEGSEAYEMFKQNWEDAANAAADAQEKVMEKTEAWGDQMKAVLENKFAGLSKSLEDALTGGTSFDALTTSMERAASLQEEYLTSTNQIYETTKMMRTAQQEIDKSSNSVAKQKLKGFIEETENLQQKNKLSKFELEMQQAKYDLVMAEIALEEAQQAKSSVRLQRDAEGNFGYVYTADSSKVDAAQQQFDDAQNALYNKGLEAANDYSQKYQQTMAEMKDTLASINEAYMAGEYASMEEYNNAMAEAKEYYYAKLEEYSSLYNIALTADSAIARDAWSSDFSEMVNSTDTWKTEVDNYIAGSRATMEEWQGVVDTLTQDVGQDYTEVAENVKNVTDESDALAKEATDEVIPALTEQMSTVNEALTQWGDYRDQLQTVIEKYEGVATAAKSAAEAIALAEAASGSSDTSSETTSSTTESSSTTEVEDTGLSDGLTVAETTLQETKPVETKIDEARATEVYDLINSGKVGTGSDRKEELKKKGFSDAEIKAGQELINLTYPPVLKGKGVAWKDAIRQVCLMDTGGYTGEWGPEGKLAVLHEKELVLNAHQTEDLLRSMEVMRDMMQILDLQTASMQMASMLAAPGFSSSSEVLEQNVHIEASFPGVQDRNEIEEAFNNLINKASQYANRK